VPTEGLTLTPGADHTVTIVAPATNDEQGGTIMTSTHALQSAAELTKAGGALDLGREPARLLVHMLRCSPAAHR
jgi:hypothetical protein